MATVGKDIADRLKAQDGYYETDPRVQRIIEYDNLAGGVSYGLEYEWDVGRYRESEWVRNPRIYWKIR